MSDIDLTEAIREASDHLHADSCPEDMCDCRCGHYDRDRHPCSVARSVIVEQLARKMFHNMFPNSDWASAEAPLTFMYRNAALAVYEDFIYTYDRAFEHGVAAQREKDVKGDNSPINPRNPFRFDSVEEEEL